MAEKRKRKPTYITEVGVAIYPWLTKADTRFNNDGEYHSKVRLPADSKIKVGDEQVELLEFLEDAAAEALAAAKKEAGGGAKAKKIKAADLPIGDHEDDDGNETGDKVFNFKMKAVVKPKDGDPFKQKPKLFDAQGKEIHPRSLFGGSKIKVAFQVIPFYTALVGAGISLRLKAVQVIELVEGQGGTAESYGFGKEEGYVAENDSPFGEEQENGSDVDTDEEQDF